jgi:hypothetical protein
MKILVSSYLATLITSSTLFSGYWLLFSSVTILMTDDYDLKFGNADFSNLYPATRFRPRPRAQSQNFIEYEDEYDDDKVGRATVPADIRASPTAECGRHGGRPYTTLSSTPQLATRNSQPARISHQTCTFQNRSCT